MNASSCTTGFIPMCADSYVQEAALAAVSAEVAAALRSKGAGGASADSANTLMGLLSSLAEPSSTASAHYTTSNGHSASASQRSSVDKVTHIATLACTEHNHHLDIRSFLLQQGRERVRSHLCVSEALCQ